MDENKFHGIGDQATKVAALLKEEFSANSRTRSSLEQGMRLIKAYFTEFDKQTGNSANQNDSALKMEMNYDRVSITIDGNTLLFFMDGLRGIDVIYGAETLDTIVDLGGALVCNGNYTFCEAQIEFYCQKLFNKRLSEAEINA